MKKQTTKLYIPKDWFQGRTVLLHPEWVTNGHVMVRRDCIKNNYDFLDQPTVQRWFDEELSCIQDLPDSYLDNLFAKNLIELQPYIVSTQLIDDRQVRQACLVLHRAEHDGPRAFVQRDYLDGLYQDDGAMWFSQTNVGPFFNAQVREEVTLVVMGCVPDKYEEALAKQEQGATA